MSYTKQTWQAGDEITSAKLNHLEDGINNVATEVANFPVEVNNPQDGDILIYNAAEQKWVSGSNSSSSGGGFLKVGIDAEGTLDKTWQEIYDAICAGYFVNIPGSLGDNVTSGIVMDCVKNYGDTFYSVVVMYSNGNILFKANSKTDYPVMVDE